MNTHKMYQVTHKFVLPVIFGMLAFSLGVLALVWVESADQALSQFAQNKESVGKKMKKLRASLVCFVSAYIISSVYIFFGDSRAWTLWGVLTAAYLMVMLIAIVIGGQKMESVMKLLQNPSEEVYDSMKRMAFCIGTMSRCILAQVIFSLLMAPTVLYKEIACPWLLVFFSFTGYDVGYMCVKSVTYIESLGKK